jgi:predicted GNAT superfamily acetyltransferase
MSTHAEARDASAGIDAGSSDRQTFEIEDLRGMARIREVEELQIAIWGSAERWIAPSHLLYVIADTGGILLGAQIDDRLVGFVLGLLGGQNGKLFHSSHMLGILPSHQQHGIGAALKWRQRERALEQGLDLMTWTFDPLESRNAYFNLHKLSVMSRIYREDYYGSMSDVLNQGLPSDRLVVEWNLRGGMPRHGETGAARPILVRQGKEPELCLEDVPPDCPLAVQVPADIQALKQQDAESALHWRVAVRQAFSWALSRGYIARDFVDGAYILVPPGHDSA